MSSFLRNMYTIMKNKPLPHSWHVWGLSEVCVNSWRLSSVLLVKTLWHVEQQCTLGGPCITECFFRRVLVENSLVQTAQMYTFSYFLDLDLDVSFKEKFEVEPSEVWGRFSSGKLTIPGCDMVNDGRNGRQGFKKLFDVINRDWSNNWDVKFFFSTTFPSWIRNSTWGGEVKFWGLMTWAGWLLMNECTGANNPWSSPPGGLDCASI